MKTVQQYQMPDGKLGELLSSVPRPNGKVSFLVDGQLRLEYLTDCRTAGSALRFKDGTHIVSSVLTAERLLPFE